jgi:hypothetical protein
MNDPRELREQSLRIRISVLEDRIRTHRRMVRDGWVSRWSPKTDANAHLWQVLGDEHERP